MVSKKLLNRKEGFRRTIKKIPGTRKRLFRFPSASRRNKKTKRTTTKKKKGIFSDSKRCIEPTYTTAEWNVLGVYEKKNQFLTEGTVFNMY